MSHLERIKKDGFDIKLVDEDFIEITPADKLTTTQLEYLKEHKVEIIAELKAEPETLVTCGKCLHFKSNNQHGRGAGTCLAGVDNNFFSLWSETPHPCDKFNAAVTWIELPEPKADSLIVVCFTPSGKEIQVEARNPEHAVWLQKMNPQREHYER